MRELQLTLGPVCLHPAFYSPGHTLEELRWPAEPLRTTLLRGLGKLGLARYAQKYEAVQVSAASAQQAASAAEPVGGSRSSQSLQDSFRASTVSAMPALSSRYLLLCEYEKQVQCAGWRVLANPPPSPFHRVMI